MEQRQIAWEVITFHKKCLDNNLRTFTLLQERMEGMLDLLLEQTTWLPQEGRKVIASWIATCRKAREEYIRSVMESYERVEEFFNIL